MLRRMEPSRQAILEEENNDSMQSIIYDNLAKLRQQIRDAAQVSGRTEDAVKLVAVTKYVEPAIARMVLDAGCCELGESRPQELWRKAEAIADPQVNWHLIGHLQRNKVRRTLPLVRCLHGCDSLRLLTELEREAAKLGLAVPVLLEVNISQDAAKHGFAPAEMEEVLANLPSTSHVQVRGLMTMASFAGGESAARRDFAALRKLRDELRSVSPGDVSLDELSMGMSRDFAIAIEEGATFVRVGSALFEGCSPGG